MTEPTGPPSSRRPPSSRPPAWQLSIAIVAVAVIVVGVVAIVLRGDGDAAVEAAAETTTTTTAPTTAPSAAPSTSVDFAAPPPQSLITTSTEAPTTTTEPPSTTTSAVLPSSTTTTTAPNAPVRARPGPVVETTSGDHEAFADALTEARDRWDDTAPPGGYRFRTRTICFCPVMDNEITVGPDGTVTEQRTIDGDPEAEPPSIDDVFDQIEELVAADPDRIRASFDRDFGYPVDYFVDISEELADDERGRKIDWLSFAAEPKPAG